MVQKVLVLKFKDEMGETNVIDFTDIKEGITGAEIKNAMDLMISSDAVLGKGGSFIARVSANMTTRNTDTFEI